MAKTIKYNPSQLIIDFDVIEKDLFLLGDIHNIRNMLPKLFHTQHEDVSFAEKRFKDGGKGYLFTNGTGTGKTYVGLGIASRFEKQGKKNILIVVPTEKKSIDWVEDGAYIGLRIHKLEGVLDKGKDITVTTYANFYQNDALNERHWDLIIYDESHYLNQNAQGTQTTYLEKHKVIANLPSTARQKAFEYPGVYKTVIEDGEEKKIINKELFDNIYKNLVESTKVVFLSATPFAYHKSIQYADGALFEINETIEPKKDSYTRYNEPSGFEAFMVENFGYRMKYNKCTIPESGVDVNLLERNFFETFKEKGVMSTRQLELEYDYSREFVVIDSEIGNFIDEGLNLFRLEEFEKEYRLLSEKAHRKHNGNYINQLLECVKAEKIHERIRKHLLLDRKVVVFHSFNNSTISHPFRFEAHQLLTEDDKYDYHDLEKEIKKFEINYPQYWNLDLSHLNNTRASIKKHFPNAKEFNGTVSKKARNLYTKEFNKDNSDVDVIIVQVKAGKEGISLHDKTGVHQRVLITLGLATAPTDAIQTEGRIYREGLKSNAIYEYITLQTDTEKYAFATKIAERSKTAENLAMGNLARDLELAFKEGYNNPTSEDPSLEQGTGGKEADRFLNEINEFDKAKTFYFKRGKKTKHNKSQEGIDYFATPEPLGMKMVEWCEPQPNEKGMEPSAGHGAIARWFPGNTTNHFIEPSFTLSAELAINATGDIHQFQFEQYYVGNKFDFICMNPPFGVGGKTAIEHVAKACKHMNWGGSRIIAIIPNGSMMQRRIEEFFLNPDNKNYVLTGEILLPPVLFERAGTNVHCKIIRIEYVTDNMKDFYTIDLSDIGDIGEFFDRIENLNF